MNKYKLNYEIETDIPIIELLSEISTGVNNAVSKTTNKYKSKIKMQPTFIICDTNKEE